MNWNRQLMLILTVLLGVEIAKADALPPEQPVVPVEQERLEKVGYERPYSANAISRDNSQTETDRDDCNAITYGGVIRYDETVSESLAHEFREEYARYLTRLTGSTFSVDSLASENSDGCWDKGQGIGLVLEPMLDDGAPFEPRHSLPAEVIDLLPALRRGYLESFIARESGGRLWLVARRESALRNAYYSHLQFLGIRFLGPLPQWIIVPEQVQMTEFSPGLVSPDWPLLHFNGASYRNHRNEDVQRRIKWIENAWERWINSSRFPREALLRGEVYDDFIKAHECEIRENPHLLANIRPEDLPLIFPRPVNQKLNTMHNAPLFENNRDCPRIFRRPPRFDPTPEPDYTSRQGLARLFPNWAYNRLRRFISDDPLGYYAQSSSVSPADGSGFSSTRKDRALLRDGPYGFLSNRNSSISDRVFHLANLAANRVWLLQRNVNLLSYSEFASVPRIPLAQNMIVQIADSSFREQTGSGIDQRISQWIRKRNTNPCGVLRNRPVDGVCPFELGLYDYVCQADVCKDLPSPDRFSVSTLERYRQLQKNGIHWISGETSNSGGYVGYVRYLTGQLAWDRDISLDAVSDEYFSLAFGPASDVVQSMYEHWDRKWTGRYHDLSQALVETEQAIALIESSGNEGHVARMRDLMAYVHYMRLQIEFARLPQGKPKSSAGDSLLRHMWRMLDTGMVHATEHHRDIYRHLLDDHRLIWDFTNADAQGWQNLPPYTFSELKALIAQDAEKYPETGVQQIDFDGEWTLLAVPGEGNPARTPLSDRQLEEFLLFHGGGSLRFSVELRGAPTGRQRSQLIEVLDQNGRRVARKRLATTPELKRHEVDVGLRAPGQYTLRRSAFDRRHRGIVEVPTRLAMVNTGRLGYIPETNFSRLYFYVPAGTTRIALSHGSRREIKFYPANGRFADRVTGRAYEPGVIVVDVPTETSGKIWAVNNIDSGTALEFLNIPTAFAFHPEHVVIQR